MKGPRRILIPGASGMLGHDMAALFQHEGHDVIHFDSSTLSLTSADAIRQGLDPYSDADILINCAAYTKVDQAESEYNLALDINGTGVKHLAQWCRDTNTTLIHFSTDYVFNGDGNEAYKEDDPVDPINAYGRSKLAGETAIQATEGLHWLIFRVQWLYGHNGKHFVSTISNLARERDELSIVNDQWGSPTWTKHIVEAVHACVPHNIPSGIYHFHNAGYCNWYDFASYFLDVQNIECTLTPIPSSHYPTPATRPHNSRLNMQKFDHLGIYTVSNWKDAVTEFLASI